MQMVTIGMHLAGEHLSHHETLETATNGFNFFGCTHFESQRGQRLSHLLRCEIEVDVFFEPFIRNVHNNVMMLYVFMPDNVDFNAMPAHNGTAFPLYQLANLVIFVVIFDKSAPKLFISL